MSGVHYGVVKYTEESIEPESLLFVLDETNFARAALRLRTSSGTDSGVTPALAREDMPTI